MIAVAAISKLFSRETLAAQVLDMPYISRIGAAMSRRTMAAV